MCRGIRSTTLRNRADKLVGEERDVLRLRPGITGPATLKYRLEDEMISDFVAFFKNANYRELTANYPKINLSEEVFVELKAKGDQEIAVWSFDYAQDKCHDTVIYPDGFDSAHHW